LSALTKLFVTLLVICSLLLTAAVTVFVNNTNDWRAAYDALEIQKQRAEQDAATQSRAAELAKAREIEAVTKAGIDLGQRNAQIENLRTDLSRQAQEIADLKLRLAQAEQTILSMADTVKASEQNVADLNRRNTELLAENDKLKSSNAAILASNLSLEKTLDATERERRWLNEQVIQLQKNLATAHALLNERGIPLDTPVARAPVTPEKLEGKILEVRDHEGRTYATINLGIVDRVQRGMRFMVVDKGDFLAFLTITEVAPNESFGYLEGPRVQSVRRDVNVNAAGL